MILHVALGLGLRQRVSSTAIVYFRRFFLKNSFEDYSGPKVRASRPHEYPAPPTPLGLPPLACPLRYRGRFARAADGNRAASSLFPVLPASTWP